MNEDLTWAAHKLEEIVAAMEDDKYFLMFQLNEQERIWREYQNSKSQLPPNAPRNISGG